MGKGTYLSQVEFHIVDHCNLNCAYCDHFTPLADKNFCNIDDIIDDFKKLKNIFDNIGKIYIVGLNRDKMKKQSLDLNGKNNKKTAFQKCWEKKCHFVRDGKLYICTSAPNVHFLNKYFNLDFKLGKNDYIDLNKVKSASYINSLFKKPIDFCRYCNDGEIEFEKYSISKKEISEWVKSQ